jgi:hypothetical protein
MDSLKELQEVECGATRREENFRKEITVIENI